jgi:hypothetical protein
MRANARALWTVAVGLGLALVLALISGRDDQGPRRLDDAPPHEPHRPPVVDVQQAREAREEPSLLRKPLPRIREADPGPTEFEKARHEAMVDWTSALDHKLFECSSAPPEGLPEPVPVIFEYDEDASADGTHHFVPQPTFVDGLDPDLRSCLQTALSAHIEIDVDVVDTEPFIEMIHLPTPSARQPT